MYWETAEDCHNELISSAISRDKFTYIMKNIHCCDNNALNKSDKFDKFAQRRPLFNILSERFMLFTPTEENYCIDEAMVPYYGRHPTKQFIRGKPIRWGYKFWVGSTRLGYVTWFEPYQGSFSQQYVESYKDLGLGPGVVLRFAVLRFADSMQESKQGMHFHFYFDNFFTILPLLDVLSQRGIKATGTVRENRLGSCPIRSSKNLKKEQTWFVPYTFVEEFKKR
ncbi:Transposase IS4 [Popillia japonica]|uniref:Transposase IS4 n=1 Tax=Popillia japonica TaxID=7064 RepID=A0AAW1IFN3_POPJA